MTSITEEKKTMRRIKVTVVLFTGLLAAAFLTGCKEKLVDVELFVEENYELYGNPEFSSYKDFELANSFTGKSEAAAKAKWEKAVRREKKLMELKQDAIAKVCRAADEQADKIKNNKEMMKTAQDTLKLMGQDFPFKCNNPIAGYWMMGIGSGLLEDVFSKAAEDALDGNKKGLEEATELTKEFIKFLFSGFDAYYSENDDERSGFTAEKSNEFLESLLDKYKSGAVYWRPYFEKVNGGTLPF